ncbi:imidazole glycerol phosphate synthase subunit HisH [Bacillus manliponensis]|uniref:imidazole glycerol phosphate synthase subunit HisH n=1 Tax=Bacillus manliponensis TaxID=574376 RepID=UPI003512C04C
MIAIVDYDMGNIHSVEQALKSIGSAYVVTDDIEHILQSDGIILPGVGTFPKAMDALQEKELDFVIKVAAAEGKPLLGICLGMQLLFEEGEEIERTKGLALLPGVVKKLNVPYKVPHMGWNQLNKVKDTPLWRDIENDAFAYYVHSYYVDCPSNIVCGVSDYGVLVPGLVAKDNVYGAQFHPEKSSDVGIQMLKNFKGVVEEWKSSQQLI